MTYVLLALAIIAIFIVGLYNSVISLKNKCDEAWSGIDTQLKRRYDLIPNVVETVKGYAKHESATFEKLTALRSQAMQAKDMGDKEKAENMLSSTLKSLFAVAENYPELKANQNFMDLQNKLAEVEDNLQLSRRYYNAVVRDFNTKIQVFPNNFLAQMLGFASRTFFEAQEPEKENVKVNFKEEEKK
ncbi:LemA family protein [Candidatus Gracilibacteria bacterium]|jgi:LemA protein|nr:LemA family protein [Candidatus Gracilibacteria bacterium]